MDFKIYANETTTVLEALKAGRDEIDSQIYAVRNGVDAYRADEIVKRMECRKETLNRVIARMEEL